MPYWCACRLQPHREALALHCLGLNGYETYYPRLRDRRTRFGRTVENRPALFPGYAFVLRAERRALLRAVTAKSLREADREVVRTR